uniref:Wsv130-like protein n=1 Tax=Pasiphaea japonica whispovirus TaxID=2984286 RepID=A0A9C7BNJ9_9VIRU|nr:MAG: wsv130-like protein [Pasiphaea japonica whispovirus]
MAATTVQLLPSSSKCFPTVAAVSTTTTTVASIETSLKNSDTKTSATKRGKKQVPKCIVANKLNKALNKVGLQSMSPVEEDTMYKIINF